MIGDYVGMRFVCMACSMFEKSTNESKSVHFSVSYQKAL